MKIADLNAVTEANLTSNVTEVVAAWDAGTSYSTGSEVSKGQRIWLSSKDNNLGNDPETSGEDSWIDNGPSNRFAMFDNYNDTQSERADNISVDIASAQRFDTLAIFDISAANVNVTVSDGSTEYHNVDYPMVDYEGIANYWDHFFNRVSRKSDLLVTGLPLYVGLTLRVTATANGETVKIGRFGFGQSEFIGHTLLGPTADFVSLSKITPDEFGRRKIVPRTYKKGLDLDVIVEKPYVDRVRKRILSYRDRPALVIASDEYTTLVSLGLIISAPVTIAYHTRSNIRMRIEDF